MAMDDGEEGDGRRGRRAAGVGRPGGVAEAGRWMQATRRMPRGRDEGVALLSLSAMVQRGRRGSSARLCLAMCVCEWQ